MHLKVRRVTNLMLDEAGGSPEVMSQIVININSQRVMKPFLPVSDTFWIERDQNVRKYKGAFSSG